MNVTTDQLVNDLTLLLDSYVDNVSARAAMRGLIGQLAARATEPSKSSTLPNDYMSNDDGPWRVSDGDWTGGTTP